MATRKLVLATATAACALAVGLGAGSAQAFDHSHWDWYLDVWTDIDIEVDVYSYFDPSGMVTVETVQIQKGDVTAYSTVYGIYNHQPVEYELVPVTLTGTTSGSLDVTGNATGFVDIDSTGANGTSSNQQAINGLVGIAGQPAGTNQSDVAGTVTGGVNGDEPNGLDVVGTTSGELDVTVSGNVYVPTGFVANAISQLPEVISTATAVGNNASIESTVAVNADAEQSLYGDWYFDAAKVEAVSDVSYILNATVDSTATAVGNNYSLTVDPATPDDAVVTANISQYSHANVNAVSNVHDVTLQGYYNLGVDELANDDLDVLGRPIVSSIATAVGNNISVSVGAIEVPEPGEEGGEE
ncbi:hypothetical protein [Inquilinus sp. CAU 1745]|uniref:hypothetical protein n=1 Tax=Inquilinus sp. CAU 1745 TaxID=3140369 RepID=UPI00325A8668